jgi:hypothetical protein
VESIPVIVVTKCGNPQRTRALLAPSLVEVADDGAIFTRPTYTQVTNLDYPVDVIAYTVLVNASKFLDTAMKIPDYKKLGHCYVPK